MANVRVYELAKELDMSNHDLLTALAGMGIEVKSHSSSLEADTVEKIRKSLKKGGGAAAVEAKPKKEAKAAEEAKPAKEAKAAEKAKPAEEAKAAEKAKPKEEPKVEAGQEARVEEEAPPEPDRKVELPAKASVRQIAELLGVATADVQRSLVKHGALVAVNQTVPQDLLKKVVEHLGFDIAVQEQPKPKAEEPKPPKAEPAPPAPRPKPVRTGKLMPRPPIVTILGHVDHGKTTLLDAIRQTNVTEQEFGGITQHIGAYQVTLEGKKITFLDTPGHEAFTAMRARGAQVTDIAILIVAADDGVMPQTIEAINHAKAAGVHIIAAINKVDKADANVDRTKQQLAEHGLVIEKWGGDIVSVDMSAKEKKGVDELLEMISLVAEVAELKADPTGPAAGTVIEAELDKSQGPVATVLVSEGTLKVGDAVVIGAAYGKVKAMLDEHGARVPKAGPATPVEIVGLSSVPAAGDYMDVVKNEREARQIAESRAEETREGKLASHTRVTLADLYRQIKEGVTKDLNVILKTDVQGSEEAIAQSLAKLADEEVRVNLIHTGVGNVGESDVLLASASNAVIVGFNVRVDPNALRAAEKESVDVRTYNIIYELLDDIEGAMLGLLEPVLEETIMGHAEVRATFKVPKGVVAGCYVTDGKAARNAEARLLRGGEVIYTGKVSSLRHIKDDVREMAAGFECGIVLDGFNDFEENDIIEMFSMQEVARRRAKS
jgi:translation initiation factor IF-2